MAYRAPRRLVGGIHQRKVSEHQKHRRAGGKKGFSKRVSSKLFRGRTVNAPRVWG